MRIQFSIALGCLVPFASAALGQISSFTLESKENTMIVTFNAPKGVPAPVVASAPYSADQVIGNVQTLADGSHVNQGTSVRHFVRDSQEAKENVDKFLDNAAVASVERVRIVHGHGMGVLRRAIAELLADNPHVG